MISNYRNSTVQHDEEAKPNLKQHYLILNDASDRIGAGLVTVLDADIQSDNPVRDLLFHNWPPGVPEYSAPVLQTVKAHIQSMVKKSLAPFYYSLADTKETILPEADKDILETLIDMEMFKGWVFPVHAPEEGAGFAVIGKIQNTLSRQDLALIHSVCINLFATYFQHKPRYASSRIQLDGSELKILQLLQVGETLNEISNKTGLSLPTVNVYCEKLMRTLGAKTVTHAVAIAIRKKLI